MIFYFTRQTGYIVLALLLCQLHAITLGSSEESKTATVLLLHMFNESSAKSPDVQLYTLLERITYAFRERGVTATIIPLTSKKRESSVLERREFLLGQIESLRTRSLKSKITHIIFAGHGSSDEHNLVIGDITLNNFTIRDLSDDFTPLQSLLAPQIKIFLFGCATFKNTGNTTEEKDILVKANWFKQLFKTESLEVFGYEYEVCSDIASHFWLDSWMTLSVAYSTVLLIGKLRQLLDEGSAFFSMRNFEDSALVITGGSLLATAHYIFDRQLKYTRLITRLRELFYYKNRGTVVSFKGSDEKELRKMLGYDYFRNEFVTGV